MLEFYSVKEAQRYGELQSLERQGLIHGLEHQTKIPLKVNNQVCMYPVNFAYLTDQNRIVVEKMKGWKPANNAFLRTLARSLGIIVYEM